MPVMDRFFDLMAVDLRKLGTCRHWRRSSEIVKITGEKTKPLSSFQGKRI